MGLFGRRKAKDRIRGSARVVSVNAPPHHASYSSCAMNLVVEGPGIEPRAVEYKKAVVAIKRWPMPGMVLPVEIDPNDPDAVEVVWDEVPNQKDRSRASAEALAQNLRGSTGSTGGVVDGATAGGGFAGGMVDQLRQAFPGAEVRVEEGVPGVPTDTSQPGDVAGVRPSVVAGRTGEDPVVRLEKLVRLKDLGVVDDEQFAQLRAQILDQAGLDQA